MAAIDLVEAHRLELQGRLDGAKSQAERNRLGQFATPTGLAVEILEYAKSLVPAQQKTRFLDPAFGTGAFYSALLKVFPRSLIKSAIGYEIDPHYGAQAAELWARTALDLRLADFTRAEPPQTEDGKVNLIVCNPPYVRHHHVPRAEKLRLGQQVREAAGIALNGLAGLYCYFLCLCHPWLARKAVAGWLMPSEFMDVNYGQAVKQYLLERVTLLRIHRFDPNQVQFDDALVSSAVVWFRNETPAPDHLVEFTYGGTLAEPEVCGRIETALLQGRSKWTRFPLARDRAPAQGRRPTLADLFTVKRGLATGANEFFILGEQQGADNGIPRDFLKPILPSPRHPTGDVIEADKRGHPVLDRPQFLLSCNLPESEVKVKYPSLWKYLERGRESGIAEGYLCRNRSPWYSQEDRPPSPFVCTYMGRQGKHKRSPFRFILNRSQATAANVYLMLYPKPLLAKVLRDHPELGEAVWRALKRISAQSLMAEGRVYGGGLHKVEPKELANAPADAVLAVLKGFVKTPPEQMTLFHP